MGVMSVRTSTDWKFRTWMALVLAVGWVGFSSLVTLYTLHKEGPGRCADYGEKHDNDNPQAFAVSIICIPFSYPF